MSGNGKRRRAPVGHLESAFGVTLYQPASIYQQNERAGKYGVLFIALTFVAFFLFEVLKKLRVHPVQYLLIGVALCTFYLLLLALSEQIGFGPAYAAAAAAVALLVGGYAAAVLSTPTVVPAISFLASAMPSTKVKTSSKTSSGKRSRVLLRVEWSGVGLSSGMPRKARSERESEQRQAMPRWESRPSK